MEEGEEVDIDVLVDHYLRATTPLLQETRATQDSWQQQEEEEEASKEIIRRPHSTSGKNYNTENSRDECVDYISNSDDDNKNEEEEDIEALVEGILHGEQHHNSSTRLPHLNENRKLEEEEEEENEQHSPLPQRVAADRRLYRHAHSASSQRSGGGGGGDGDQLLRRLMLWQERRDAKRLQAVYEALLQEQAECTFHPRESASPSRGGSSSGSVDWDAAIGIDQVNGVDSFLQRMRDARVAREQKQRAEEEEVRRYSDPATWNPKLTKPRPFVLGRKPRRATASITSMDTFNRYAAGIRAQLQNEPSKIEGPSVPSGLFSILSSELLLQHIPQRTTLPH